MKTLQMKILTLMMKKRVMEMRMWMLKHGMMMKTWWSGRKRLKMSLKRILGQKMRKKMERMEKVMKNKKAKIKLMNFQKAQTK